MELRETFRLHLQLCKLRLYKSNMKSFTTTLTNRKRCEIVRGPSRKIWCAIELWRAKKKGKGNFGHMLKQPCMHVKRRKPSSKYFSLLFYYFFIFVYSKMSLNRSDYFFVPSVYIRHQVDELLYTFFFIFRLLPAHYSLKISKNSFSHSISSFLLCFYSRIHFLISREREIC